MKNVYGYIDNGSFVETGFTERGAKIAASKAGCGDVGYRSYINNMYIATASKSFDTWLKVVYY